MNKRKVLSEICFRLCSIFPIKKKIIFMSGATAYACNPKYLSNALLKKGNYDIRWVFMRNVIDTVELPKEITKIKYHSLKYFYEMSTAAVIVNNHRLHQYDIKKRKGQKYIQTWHSSMRLKKIEGDAEESLSKDYIEMAKKDSDNIDLIISGCDFSTNFYLRSFWYEGEIAKTGTPRIDYIMQPHPEISKSVAKYFNTSNKLLLYAPTFRKNKDISFYNINGKSVIETLKNRYGSEWTILSRLHPNLINEMSKLRTDKGILNATKYNDIQDLIIASEFVITDYSSSMFDCAFIRKPCILYMPDYEEYISKERALYFDIQELPFPKAYNQEELHRCIAEFDYKKYCNEIESFLEKIGSYEDGHACERIEKIIRGYIDER